MNLRDIRREQGFSQNAVPQQASSTFMDRVKSRVTNTASNVGANAGSSWDNCLSSLGGSCSALQTAWGSMFNYTRIQLGYLAVRHWSYSLVCQDARSRPVSPTHTHACTEALYKHNNLANDFINCIDAHMRV